MRVRDQILEQLACNHMPPLRVDRCATCRELQLQGFDHHWWLVQHDPVYAHRWVRKLRTELWLYRTLKLIPVAHLMFSWLFWYCALTAILFAIGVIRDVPEFSDLGGEMLIRGALALSSYWVCRWLERTYA